MELFLVALSVFAAGIPMLSFVVIMVLLDRYEREPWWLVGLTFGWGAFGAVVIAVVGSLLLAVPITAAVGAQGADVAGTIFVAPFVEEPAKALILVVIAATRYFDGPTDGFVYGAAAGLGFGMTENFMYFAVVAVEGSVGPWVGVVVVRTLFTAMMHACATSVVGAIVGYAKFRPFRQGLVLVPLGLLAAMAIHAAWNGPLALEAVAHTGGALTLVAYVVFPIEFVILFGIYQWCLWSESRMIRLQLGDEAAAGTLPKAHVEPIGSWMARLRSSSWLPEGVEASEYIQAATLLAFRRHQLGLHPGDPTLRKDVEALRSRVRELLGPG